MSEANENNSSNNELLLQILQTLNMFQLQTTASFNELRAEIKENKKEIQKSREIENAHWEENKRLWAENKKRWEENDKRWEENNKRWEENDKRWDQNEKTREKEHQELLDILLQFDITISTKLGDPNVEKMKKVLGM